MTTATYLISDEAAFTGFKFASEAVADHFFKAVGNELHRLIDQEYCQIPYEELDEFTLNIPTQFEAYYRRPVYPIVVTNRHPVTEETVSALFISHHLLSADCPKYRFTDVFCANVDADELPGYDKETSLVFKHELDNVQATTADSVPESFKTLKELAAYVESAMFSLQA